MREREGVGGTGSCTDHLKWMTLESVGIRGDLSEDNENRFLIVKGGPEVLRPVLKNKERFNKENNINLTTKG